MLRKDPAAVGQQPDGDPAPALTPSDAPESSLRPVMAEARFWRLTAALVLASLVTVATSVHLIPYLTGRGTPPATAAAMLGLIGLMQLPGRLLFGPIRRRFPWQWTAATVFLLQAGAVALLAAAGGGAGMIAFVALFGIANGMSTLLRASTLAVLYGPARYGRVSGVVALFSTLGRAAGPVVASLAYTAAGGYEKAFAGLTLALVLAAALVLRP
jgi:hypothetical protein